MALKFSIAELQALFDPKSTDQLKALGGLEGLARGLEVNLQTGISANELVAPPAGSASASPAPSGALVAAGTGAQAAKNRRVAQYGENRLPEAPVKKIWHLIWQAYHDKILIGLTIAAFVSLGVGIWEDTQTDDPAEKVHWIEGVAIIIAVVVVILVASINDLQKEAQFRKLNAKKEDRTVKVVRDAQKQQISVFDLVVGDVLEMEPGDVLPVDGVLIKGHNLKCDESGATGESDLIKKSDEKDPFLLSGSKVAEGMGQCLVAAVGPYSFNGKTMLGLRVPPSETPLQLKLDRLAETIAKLGLSVSLLLLIVLIIKYCATNARNQSWGSSSKITDDIVQIVIQAITMLVVAVPEGLPLAVTLALAYATTRMLKDNNLVRVLAACETMGNATCVCSDKTGTLTQNRMTVVAGALERAGSGGDADEPLRFVESTIGEQMKTLPQALRDRWEEAIAVNSTAFEDRDEHGKAFFVGSKTETALLEFARRFLGEAWSYLALRQSLKIEKVFPFSSEKKSMCTFVKKFSATGEVTYRAYLKGASEIVLGMCGGDAEKGGEVGSAPYRTRARETISAFAEQSLRTIGLAYRDFTEAEAAQLGLETLEEPPHGGFTWMGVVGIEDPVRPGVPEAVARCQKAGVFIRMVTGDNLQTAKAIATKCGIYMKGGIVMEGIKFRNLSEREMDAVIPRLQVLARSSPTDKQVLVRRLKHLGEVVAVTGDGTNDGPALKAADVGFSMGIAGTEVAKEASSIILMDDNFASIVSALTWGRAVNDAVRKFLQFQLTVNVTAVVLTFFSACYDSGNEGVLTAVQLLWVNLIMDSLGALALATEPPTKELLERFPEDKRSFLVSPSMMKMIFGQSVFQLAVAITLLVAGPDIFDLDVHNKLADKLVLRSLIFNTFVFMQLFNEINCRRIDNNLNVIRNLHRNNYFMSILVFVTVLQVIIVEYGGPAFKTVHLPGEYWAVSILIGFLSIPVGIIIRLVPLPEKWLIPRAVRENERVFMTRERLQWISVVGQVTTQLSVFRALRGNRVIGSGAAPQPGRSSLSIEMANRAEAKASNGTEASAQQPLQPPPQQKVGWDALFDKLRE